MRKTVIFISIVSLLSFVWIHISGRDKDDVPISPKIDTYKFKEVVPKTYQSIDQLDINPIKNQISTSSGTFSLYIKELSTNKIYEINSSEVMYGASLFKVPLAVAILNQVEIGKIKESAVRNNLNAMLKNSDNVAQQLLDDNITDSTLQEAFTLNKKLPVSAFFHENKVSAKEMGFYLENILESDYLENSSKTYLLETMSKTIYDNRIHAGLTKELIFSHKIGNWAETGSWHDCGYLMKERYEPEIIVCLMSNGTTYEDFLNVASIVGKEIGRPIF